MTDSTCAITLPAPMRARTHRFRAGGCTGRRIGLPLLRRLIGTRMHDDKLRDRRTPTMIACVCLALAAVAVSLAAIGLGNPIALVAVGSFTLGMVYPDIRDGVRGHGGTHKRR